MKTGRIIHIAEHYEKQNANVSKWSPSLVVKGLLKQFDYAFNVAKAWKEFVGQTPNSDRLLEWPEHNASLKLAIKPPPKPGNPRTSPNSKAVVHTSPMNFLGSELRGWSSSSEAMTQAPTYATIQRPRDFDMLDSGTMTSYI